MHSRLFERIYTKAMTTDYKYLRSIEIVLWDGNPIGTRSAAIDGSLTQAIGFRRNQLKELRSELVEKIKKTGGLHPDGWE